MAGEDEEQGRESAGDSGSSLPSADALAAIFHDISDSRIHTVILKRAAGESWKIAADAAGVTERRVYQWKHEYPLDERAAMLALEVAKQGALRLLSSYAEAADFIATTLRDGDAKTSERLTAAKTVITEVHRIAGPLQDHAKQGTRVPPTPRPEPADAIDTTGETVARDRSDDTGLSARIRKRRPPARGRGSEE